MKITLKNINSYGKEPQCLELDKKIGLAYGLNGTGKSTLSNYLYDENSTLRSKNYKDCHLNGIDQKKLLVFNQKFIRDNFYDVDTQKGVFNLSRENKEISEQIDRINSDLKKEQEAHGTMGKEKEEMEKKKDKVKEKASGKTWLIQKIYDGEGRPLSYCFKGKKARKEVLFNYIKDNIPLPTETPTETVEDLKAQAQNLLQNPQPISRLPPPNNSEIVQAEQDTIWEKQIKGKEDIYLSELIAELENADWVSKGRDYLERNETHCPFCQQTVTKDFIEALEKYFDEQYEQGQTKISEFDKQYDEFMNKLEQFSSTWKEPYDPSRWRDEMQGIDDAVNELRIKLNAISKSIKNKRRKLDETIVLGSSQTEREKLSEAIDSLNQKIDQYNQGLQNPEQIKSDVESKFWNLMRHKHNDTIEEFIEESKKIDASINQLDDKIASKKEKIKCKREEIKSLQNQISNTDVPISNINTHLKECGLIGFSIEPDESEDHHYRIRRESSNGDQVFVSLSEGEKTLIAFLYFVELCIGQDSPDEELRNKIVVIDDPVSSLSHLQVFNISQMILTKLCQMEELEKILVLTHSLYFLSELQKIVDPKNEKTSLFRFIKVDKNGRPVSKIRPMKEKEIRNDYEAYWAIVKDGECDVALPNAMRNILEHFFGFIQRRKDLKEAFKKLPELDSIKTKAFIRYINRESHSDSINISDYKEVDQVHFKKCFKAIFTVSEYEEHYNIHMMEPTD